ncbi:C4-dicarboxylate transporter DctM subunit [Arthrobacter pigmenti]|uniref:C4-dicarboxylate transporter DctM subunit n=1 Tax=Arthrobacter pigmenti TaxID=271432 RepID=A0A846RES5_9MICC|nr:C4-dicarboxylate transporter DctM subunit [Arthrobacter pigmenti]
MELRETVVDPSEQLPAAETPARGWLRQFDLGLDSIGASLLIIMVGVTALQIVMRYVFNAALPWPEEAARWAFLWLVMLSAATATRHGSHIRMTTLVHWLPRSTWRYTDLLGIGLSAASLTLIGYLGVNLMRETTAVAINLGISYSWLYLALPVGATLSLLALLRAHVRDTFRGSVFLAVAGGVLFASLVAFFVSESILVIFDTTAIAVTACLVLLLLGAPVAHALLLGSAIAYEAGRLPEIVIANNFASSVSTNFVMLAIPFFILMGALMNASGITAALIRVAVAFVGHWRGGLGQVNILTSAMLGGLSGSSSADTAIVGKTLVGPMEKTGYSREYASAITASAAITATLIPPSISFLIYASLAGVSVGALFMAGIVPGLLFAATLMVAVWWLSGRGKNKVDSVDKAPSRERLTSLLYATPAFALPLGILMMLRAGVVTATEAGAAACILALLLGFLVFRKLRASGAWESVRESAHDTGVILFLLAASGPLAWILIAEEVPANLAEALTDIENQTLLMLGIVLFLLMLGLILEPPPAMVLIVPVLAPLAAAAGIDLIHLGVVLVLAIMIGQLTPPVGGLVYIAATVTKSKVGRVFWEIRWLYVPMGVVLLLLTLFPALSLWLPQALGFQ